MSPAWKTSALYPAQLKTLLKGALVHGHSRGDDGITGAHVSFLTLLLYPKLSTLACKRAF